MLSLIPAPKPYMTRSGAELRVCMSLGTQSTFHRRDAAENQLAVSQLKRINGSTQEFSCRSLVEMVGFCELSDGSGGVVMADGFSGRYDKYPNAKLQEKCCRKILGIHHSLIREFMEVHAVAITSDSQLPPSPLIVAGGIANECHRVRVKCELKLDVLAQIPDFTAAARWHLGLLQRGKVINRQWRLKYPEIVPMEPAGAMEFFTKVFPRAFFTDVHPGQWLPARIWPCRGDSSTDVIVQLVMPTKDGTVEIDIWSHEQSIRVEAGMELWRVVEWEEHQQWDERGEPIDVAQSAHSNWCIGKIIQVQNAS